MALLIKLIYRLVFKQPIKLVGYYTGKKNPYKKIRFIVDSRDWVIFWYAKYITDYVRNRYGVKTSIKRNFDSDYYCVVHFGSQFSYTANLEDLHPSNRVIVTFFHGKKTDLDPNMGKCINIFQERIRYIDKVVTACSIMEERLISWGVPRHKLERIPLGVDTTLFVPATSENKNRAKSGLGIPRDAICIGSFQKDGNGWGEGLEPKLIKGPDILIGALKGLALKYNIYVLLTGPGRGYVKKSLEENGIPYKHVYLKDYREILRYYHALDLYLVTSREEGGPKAVLESMASGIPIVSTCVGMAPDVIKNGENGFLVDVEDVDGLISCASELIEKHDLCYQFRVNGLKHIKRFDWSNIAIEYYERVYRPLLDL